MRTRDSYLLVCGNDGRIAELDDIFRRVFLFKQRCDVEVVPGKPTARCS